MLHVCVGLKLNLKPETWNMEPNVIDTTENCRHCLMCRHMCPVGHVTHLESLTPHGWGQVVASEKRGLIAWNDSTVDVMYSCADCGVCESHCVTDQPLPDAIAAVRANLVASNLTSPVINDLKTRFEEWGNVYAEKYPETVSKEGDTALFVGDVAAYRSPGTLESVLKLLRGVDLDPVLIGVGLNSGFLASSMGLFDLATKLASRNLSDLKKSGAKRLLVLSPGDYYTWTSVYKNRLGVDGPADVSVEDVVSVLDDEHEKGNLKFQKAEIGLPYAYIDPTHAVRMPGRFEAPRRLLRAILPMEPLELFWRKERAHPCGDGALEFTKPGIADKLTLARLEDAQNQGAQGVVTEDPATLYQLNRHASFGLPAKGLYEILADRID